MRWLLVLLILGVAFDGEAGRRRVVGGSGEIVDTRDFEEGASGTYAFPCAGAFDDRPADEAPWGWAETRYNVEEVFEGTQSAKVTVHAGQHSLGGRVYFVEPLRKGDEVWVRLGVRWNAGFSFSARPMLKFLRMKPRLPDSTDSYDNDLLLNNPNGVNVPFVFSLSWGPGNVYFGEPGLDDPVRAVWESYEWYEKLDDAAGGTSRTKVWRNGVLILNTTKPILKTTNHQIEMLEVLGYWNGGSPQTQSLWIDELETTVLLAP